MMMTTTAVSLSNSTVSYEVVDAVQRKLEKEGILQSIRAQLRESVLRVISTGTTTTIESSNQRRQSTLNLGDLDANRKMALVLVRDLLETLQLSETLSLFNSEIQSQMSISSSHNKNSNTFDWYRENYQHTKQTLVLFLSSNDHDVDFKSDREFSMLETLIKLRQKDLSNESKSHSSVGTTALESKASDSSVKNKFDRKEELSANKFQDLATQKGDAKSNLTNSEKKKTVLDDYDDDEIESDLEIQYGHDSQTNDDADDYVMVKESSVPKDVSAAESKANDSQAQHKEPSSSRTDFAKSLRQSDTERHNDDSKLSLNESSSFEDSNIELMSNSMNTDIPLPVPQPVSIKSLSTLGSLPALKSVESLPSVKPIAHSSDFKQERDDPDTVEEGDDGPENGSDSDSDREKVPDKAAGGLSRTPLGRGSLSLGQGDIDSKGASLATRHIAVKGGLTDSLDGLSTGGTSRASVQRLGQGSTVSRSLSGWGQLDENRYDDFADEEKDESLSRRCLFQLFILMTID